MSLTLIHTQTGRTKRFLGSLHWLYAFLFTPIYYACKGMWVHSLIALITGWFAGVVTLGISTLLIGLFCAVLNRHMVRQHFVRRGWEFPEGALTAQSSGVDYNVERKKQLVFMALTLIAVIALFAFDWTMIVENLYRSLHGQDS